MIAEKIARQIARHNAALAGKPAPDVELEAALAFQRTTKRIAAAIAREIVVPEKTVQDWGNVNSGDRGPHLTLLYVTQLAALMRPLAGERSDVFAALDFVERQLGRVAFEPPHAAATSPADLAKQIAWLVMQLGEFIELAVTDPSRRTPEMMTRLHQEKADVIAALEQLFPSPPVEEPPAPTANAGGSVTPIRAPRA